MSLQVIISWLLTITALATFINHRFLRLPDSIGVTLVAMLLSLLLILVGTIENRINENLSYFFEHFDISTTVLDGLLSFLLFAGSLHVNAIDLARYKYTISMLASFGVILSTLLVGLLLWLIAPLLGFKVPVEYCFLFGALISPTDPIAVLGVLKRVHAPKNLEMKITGESLFNDGVGIVLFLTILRITLQENTYIPVHDTLIMFVREVFGGIFVGYVLAKIANWFITRSYDFEVALFITLSLVTGGYTLAHHVIGVSGPITMAMAGLVVGNCGRSKPLQKYTMDKLGEFWVLVDQLLNSILFVLIGLEVLFLAFHPHNLLLGVVAIPIVLISRYISVALPVMITPSINFYRARIVSVMTWGGMRGGVSIALALMLPESQYRDLIIALTYIVVIFSILVQGLTIGRLIKRLYPVCHD